MRITTAIATALAGPAFMLAAATGALAAADPTGIWINDTGRGAVEIKPCGNALCGHVVWVKDTSDTKGCRKQIIGDATSVGGGRWDSGWIYSPEKRKNYDVELKPLSDGTLRVVGYAGTKLFSRTMIWTRAPADLKRCDAIEAKAAPAPALEPAKPAVPAPVTPSTAEVKPSVAQDAAKDSTKPVETAATAPAKSPADVKDANSKDVNSKDKAPSISPPVTETPEVAKTETDDDSEVGEKPGERSSGGGIKLGDLDLDKVLTKSADGKCKLDLPWVKVKFDCNRE